MPSTFVTFALFLQSSGQPVTGQTPQVVALKLANGTNRDLPTVVELGGGLYGFGVTAADLALGVAYLVDAGTAAVYSSRYFSGAIGGRLVAFALYDPFTGAPVTGKAPSILTLRTRTGSSPAIPPVVELGGGLYGFELPASTLATGVGYIVRTLGAVVPDYLTGYVEAPLEDVATPTPAEPSTPLPADALGAGEVRDLLLGEDGDWVASGGDLLVVRGLPGIRQNIRTACELVAGEWFLDESEGLPLFSEILVANPRMERVRAALRARILSVRGVSNVALSINFDAKARTLDVSATAYTSEGTVTESLRFEG